MIEVKCILKGSSYSERDGCYYVTFKSEILTLPPETTVFCFYCTDLKEGLSWINLNDIEQISTRPYDNPGQFA